MMRWAMLGVLARTWTLGCEGNAPAKAETSLIAEPLVPTSPSPIPMPYPNTNTVKDSPLGPRAKTKVTLVGAGEVSLGKGDAGTPINPDITGAGGTSADGG